MDWSHAEKRGRENTKGKEAGRQEDLIITEEDRLSKKQVEAGMN
jgi:hypothetical protein